MRTTSSARLLHLRRGLARFVPAVCYAVFIGLVVGISPQTVLAQLSCTISQITDSQTFSDVPWISADGTRIAFESGANLTGDNPDGNSEIFLYDTVSDTLTQITSTTAGQSSIPTINADGTRIAFKSSANLTGGNPDGTEEIFLFDTTTNTLSQITNTTGSVGSFRIVSNADGTRIAFESSANLTGGNPDGNFEVFLYDTTAGTLTQITNTNGAFSGSPSINADGTRLVFQSGANLTGGNPDCNREIFLYNATTGTYTQITSTTVGGSFESPINSDGTRIALASTANLTGGNPDGTEEIFLYNATSGTFTQITSATAGNSFEPSISADGTRIAFSSRADLTGGNPESNEEIFLFDTTTNTLTQITSSTGGVSQFPTISANGSRIAFESTANLTGGNPDGNFEVFLASCNGTVVNADLVITKADSADPVRVRTPLTYTLTVTNQGPAPATGVTVADPLPSGVTFGSAAATQGSCSQTTGTVTCTLGNLANSASATVTITVTPTAPGTLTNSASVHGNEADPNGANDSDMESTVVTTSGQPSQLKVMVQGKGKVTSSPPGINCKPDCTEAYNNGTVVQLTATPDTGYQFDHWEGGCTGTTSSCAVTITSSVTVNAFFKKQ
jgi:uncharacterized repeat protein (TIGR01451 family)